MCNYFNKDIFDSFEFVVRAIFQRGWTVNYAAMRGLGMADSFPAGDLGIVKALTDGDKKPLKKEITEIAEKWRFTYRPYRAYAALCLWNSYKKGYK